MTLIMSPDVSLKSVAVYLSYVATAQSSLHHTEPVESIWLFVLSDQQPSLITRGTPEPRNTTLLNFLFLISLNTVKPQQILREWEEVKSYTSSSALHAIDERGLFDATRLLKREAESRQVKHQCQSSVRSD